MADGKRSLKLPRKAHLRLRREFLRLKNEGNRVVSGCLILNWLPLAEGSKSKVGVIVTKRLGKAVVRNRARRLLLEAFRLSQNAIVQPVEAVLVARDQIKGLKLADVKRDLLLAFEKAGLLRKNE